MKESQTKRHHPLTLNPLSVDEAVSDLLKVKPAPKAKYATRKKRLSPAQKCGAGQVLE